VSRQQLTLRLTGAEVPRAETLLELAGAEAIALRDAADDPVLEPARDTAPLWPNVVLRALFPGTADLEHLRNALRSALPNVPVEIAALHDADWRGAMRQVFAARPIGARAWLAPAEDTAVPDGRIGIRLNMGLAFGTGEHPTTALCLEWLEAHVRSGATILDYGCGSGVLAIAALTLGASRGFAVDNDPQALDATLANAALNDVAERLLIGLPEDLPPIVADILAANILAGPLIELAPQFAGRVRAGGALVLSGILEAQAADVIAAYEPFFSGFERGVRGGWVRIAATRRNAG
jgi:ribosomal protein L11 methyltransferase